MKTTKSMLSEKAIELFRIEGFEKVSIDRICEACNVTKGAFYHHFSSKDDLLIDYVNSEFLHHFDNYILEIIDIEDPREQIWSIFCAASEYWLIMGRKLANILWINILKKNMLFSFQMPEYEKTRSLLLKLIAMGIEKDLIHTSNDPEEILTALYSFAMGLSLHWVTGNCSDYLSVLRKQFDMILV